jgi:succinoglycan biosynthesis protein ExoM
MTAPATHITVCICTYKRPQLLKRLLDELRHQNTEGLFTYSIVVADNDGSRSARATVDAFAATSQVPVRYCVQPRQNIAMTRNTAVENATGQFIAFIDDDEFPTGEWLLNLFKTLRDRTVDGVLGPVRPHFEADAPQWVIDGRFYDRPPHPTGMILDWTQCRTGNVLLKRDLFAGDPQPFRPECLSGEDQDFFKRMIEQGRVFTWCHEAAAYEAVPPGRWKRGFMIRRALFRGVFSLRNRRASLIPIAYSFLAAVGYSLALPVALLFGQARFMRCVFTLCYHLGRLLAFVGINPLGGAYVTE